MKKNIEVEGGELILRNKAGDHVVIPKKYRAEVQDMIKEGCHGCIDALVDTLPVMDNYAEDGTVIPQDPPRNIPGIYPDNMYSKMKESVNKLNTTKHSINDIKEYYTVYLNSPKYRERWNNIYGNPKLSNEDNMLNFRKYQARALEYISDPKVKLFYGDYDQDFGENYTEVGSSYNHFNKTVSIDMNEQNIKKIYVDENGNEVHFLQSVYDDYKLVPYTDEQLKLTIAHEFAHGIDYATRRSILHGAYNDRMDKMMQGKKRFDIIKANMSTNQDLNYHDKSTLERYADIQAIRYLMYADKVYDPGKENFTAEHLKILKENYLKRDKLADYKRFFELHTDDQIIKLMNILAQNDNNNETIG